MFSRACHARLHVTQRRVLVVLWRCIFHSALPKSTILCLVPENVVFLSKAPNIAASRLFAVVLIHRSLHWFYCVGGDVKPSVEHMAAVSLCTGGLLCVRLMPEASRWLHALTTTKTMFQDMIIETQQINGDEIKI